MARVHQLSQFLTATLEQHTQVLRWRIDFTDGVGHLGGSHSPEPNKDLTGRIHSLGSDSAQRPFPTESKGGSCCNLANDVMSAFCRRLGNSAPEMCLPRPNFADEGLVFSNI